MPPHLCGRASTKMPASAVTDTWLGQVWFHPADRADAAREPERVWNGRLDTALQQKCTCGHDRLLRRSFRNPPEGQCRIIIANWRLPFITKGDEACRIHSLLEWYGPGQRGLCGDGSPVSGSGFLRAGRRTCESAQARSWRRSRRLHRLWQTHSTKRRPASLAEDGRSGASPKRT